MTLRPILPIVVATLTAVCFLPAVSGSFLHWDDNVNFTDNSAYRGLGWDQIRWAFTSTLFGHYIPLTRLSWSLSYWLGGMNPWGYYLVNVLLHVGNAVGFYFVARRLLSAAANQGAQGERWEPDICVAAAVAALVFSIHPLRAEPVAWITGRADVLCGTFVLIASFVYLRAVEDGGRASPRLVLMSGVALAAGLLSKGTALPLPAAMLLLDVYPLRRLSRLGAWALVREKVSLFLISLVGAIVVILAVRRGAVFTDSGNYGALSRLAVATYCFSIYPIRLLWPASLSPLYEMPAQVSLLEPRFTFTAIVCLLVTAILIFLRRSWPGGLAAWSFSAIMLAPTSLALRLGADLAPDRYSYLSGLGFATLVGGAVIVTLRRFGGPRSGRRAVVIGAGLVVSAAIVALGLATVLQVRIWHDDEKLWRHALRLDPTSAAALSNLGSILRIQGRLEEAVEYSSRALLLKPEFPEAHLNLALARARQGRTAEAERHFLRSLELKPRSAPALSGLASLLETEGRVDEALDHFRRALQIDPGSATVHNDLGVALARHGRLGEALAEFTEAVRLDPSSAEAQNNLGLALAQTGRLNEAFDHFHAAIRSEPGHQQARRNLEQARHLLGR